MQNNEIIFYRTAQKECPMLEFLNGLDMKMRAKVTRTVDLLRDNGGALREPYSKPLTDGIFELRIKVGTNITRVLYFFVIGNKIVLTHGFVKKTQKTPPAEIDRAKRCRADYLSRQHENDDVGKEN
ncbi:MAG: type II toxin-antitoxin system RelE/ParE family toxin [Lachnospiraceae bacterium]|nr:type II toxin-antitoxin system RelE/ParE family toxin [Ruminococcus sp.]MCM1276363.1 type II toxin-antitoxin system RelE/ParE family toxin [Lachnospiraceae bacterium]